MPRISSLLVVLSSLGAMACGRPDDSSGTWTGGLAESDAVVGAVVSGDRASIYVCGGNSTFATMTRWFHGSREELAGGLARDGWVVDAAIGNDSLAGHVFSPDGGALAFSLGAAEEGSVSGLYSTLDAGCRTGVVVSAGLPGEAPEMQGVWCSETGEVDQVTPGIAPLVLEDGALAVAVDRPDGLHELLVRPFLP